MSGAVVLDPLMPVIVLGVLAALVVVYVALALWRGLSGWWLRGLAGLSLMFALFNPSLQSETRDSLTDIVIVLADESASQQISDRPSQTQTALEIVQAELAAIPNVDVQIVQVGDGADDTGTLAFGALAETLAETPIGRLAGVIAITDGQIHDADIAPGLPAPLHAILTGLQSDWDRRLVVKNAPAFAILDEETSLTVRIEDQGAAPQDSARVPLAISIDGQPPSVVQAPLGQDIELPITITHGGTNVVHLTVQPVDGELTDRNNSAVIRINGVRDRLRVLLVSGEPHAGERTWRNLLKSDGSVDLVHFTILRPPEKQDGVPVSELSLIAFPTRELFLEKVDEFDLIIFDRYKRRGILPSIYLENVVEYVRGGGAVLMAAGPDFAGADSLYRSPLAEILPARPSARVISEGFRPQLTEMGARHPVTQDLDTEWGGAENGWGRWFRMVELEAPIGATVMSGPQDSPLLVLNRVEEGRVALLASDHAWLWSRGYEGGGPQLELLRRLAHWMMKEPELEEEALSADVVGQTVTIRRRSLADEERSVQITDPDGQVTGLQLQQVRPGEFRADFEAQQIGLYRLSDGSHDIVVGVGPSAPREFIETVASDAKLAPALARSGGQALRIENGAFDIRAVRAGRPAAGRGWIGITPRQAFLTTDITLTPLAPAWLMLLLAAALSVGAWLREGRR